MILQYFTANAKHLLFTNCH